MTTIKQRVDLNTGANSIDGWETNGARARDVVVYTGNWFAAWSADGGNTFRTIDADGMCRRHGQSLCCDQVVTYVPKINTFCWILQTNEGDYVLAVASPEDVATSSGTRWTSYLIPAGRFGVEGAKADYPEVSYGDNFLYLTFNLIGKYSIGLRLKLGEIAERATLHMEYLAAKNNYWLRPVQATGSSGYFVAQNSASALRVFRWGEPDHWFSWFDVKIPTIPTEEFAVKTPSGPEWLGSTSKVDWHIYGATRANRFLWAAWNGARRVADQKQNRFAYPHIGIAVIDLQARALAEMQYIWNPEHGFAWPALATNARNEVGLSFCWGGNRWDPQHGVAVLTGPGRSFLATTSGPTNGAGGHYISIRSAWPDEARFDATGFVQRQTPTAAVNNPQYVSFNS